MADEPQAAEQEPAAPATWRPYAAEFLGAFVLVLVGTVAIVAAERQSVSVLVAVPFAFGLGLLGGLYTFAEVSGGHFNPAVSLAMFLDQRLSLDDLIGYWVAQFLGAIAASVLLLIGTSQDAVATTANAPSAGDGTAFLFETTFTAIFVLVILQSSKSERYRGSALVAIPLTLVAMHFALIPFTGCSLNPARSFGPALVGNAWSGLWIFMIAPPLGAGIAWAIYSRVVSEPAPA
jgi:aquaporin Z